jgi:CHAT domain-containing protein
MNNTYFSCKQSFLRFVSTACSFCLVGFATLSPVLFTACVKQKMSLKEAKQVSVSMSTKAFVPPPRRANDILAVLNQPGQFDESITAAIKAKADALPPQTDNPKKLAQFYWDRGVNARELGRYQQQLEDLGLALSYAERAKGLHKKFHMRILFDAGVAEAVAGNLQRAIDLLKASIQKQPWPSNYYVLAWTYFETGDFKAGEKATQDGLKLTDEYFINASGDRGRAALLINKGRLNANLLYYKGLYAEAEPLRRSYLNKMRQSFFRKEYPWVYLAHRVKLAKNLALQGRLVEAELEAREALQEALGHGGKNSGSTGEIINMLGDILLLQGRTAEAEQVIHAGIRICKESGLPEDSQLMGDVKMLLCKVSVARHNYAGAAAQFDQIRSGMKENQYYFDKNIGRSPDAIISLIKTGRVDQAMPLVSAAFTTYRENLGKNNYRTAEMLALRGMAHTAQTNTAQALADFTESLPMLFKDTAGAANDYMKKQHLKIIAEAYLDLLEDIYTGGQEKKHNLDIAFESFRLVEQIRGSRVQKAMGDSGARAAATDPELADLVRKAQDAKRQIDAMQGTLTSVLAAPLDQQNPTAMQELKTSIDALKRARMALLDEIKERFPKYADFTDPQPVSFAKVQQHLLPNEAFVSIYPTADQTYVWAIPKSGNVAFTVVGLGDQELRKTVSRLRQALDPGPIRFGDIPDFDMASSYALYRQLLLPVAAGWKDAQDLIVVVSGPLGTIPLSILPTAPVELGPEIGLLFERYKEVPWLIRNVSITRTPSATAFVTLRTIPEGPPGRKAFAGFGDPLFNLEQLAQAEKETSENKIFLATRGGRMYVRGIRITAKGALDQTDISSVDIGMLNRLPDTREEILSIAGATGANPHTDTFLGKQAAERRVKTMNLADRRVIAFATHALIPGDLDGLHQPAIALSAPIVTNDNDDGLLTMEEILKLRLNADWVVLSACNTGAAQGAGAEALSGLGQAFFYAGSRAMLVTMWPVETTSAKKLTTGLFELQKANASLTRSRALQQSILKLIDDPGLQDQASGKIVASYAHPMLWAPFIIVGEGGGT